MNVFTDLKKWNALSNAVPKDKSDTIDYLAMGQIVFDKVIKVENFARNVPVDVNIDLSPALEEGKIGQVAVVVCPTQKG